MENNINQDSDFLKEKIKQRPLNRKKLLRKTIITALMAVLFGTIACLTFLLLEPVISNKIYPEEGPEVIAFPEEGVEEEILPEDMYADEAQMQAESMDSKETAVNDAYIREILEKLLSEKEAGTKEYISMNSSMLAIAKETGKSIVTVTGITSDVDLFNDAYENKGQTTGSIVHDNGQDYLILVNMNSINDAETIMVTFADGSQYPAEIQSKNAITGFTILSVSKADMESETLQQIKIMEWGNSSAAGGIGTPVIAVGRVAGNAESICYGFITSVVDSMNLVDASYKMILTDIYGSSNAAGLLINMQGQMVGIIDNSYNSSDMPHMVSAIGITGLYQLIKSMSDDVEKAYSGIRGMDVTQEIHEVQEVPLGAYVMETEPDSPAMKAGIRSGDVIVKVEDKEISSFRKYVDALFRYHPEQSVTLTVMRQGTEGYRSVEITMVLGHSS